MIALAAKTDVILIRIEQGMHVDRSAGSLYFSVPADEAIEVHAEEAMLRPESTQGTQARVTILASKVLQVSAMHGNLDFSYREEFHSLPEGQTYRIYLDSLPNPKLPLVVEAPKPASQAKSPISSWELHWGDAAVWKVRDRNSSGGAPESPRRP